MAPLSLGEGASIRDELYLARSPSGENLTFAPSFDAYQNRSAFIKEKVDITQHGLPNNFPSQIDGPLNWTGSELEEKDWLVNLDQEDILSIEAATENHLQIWDSVRCVSPASFPISDRLAEKLRGTVGKLYDGCGFAIIRGLKPEKYDPLERMVIFMGLSSYVGNRLGVQDNKGNALCHLTNMYPLFKEGEVNSPGYSNVHMPFHTDIADVIANFFIGVADNGGASLIASSSKVYNDLAASKPHVLNTLANKWQLNQFSSSKYTDSYYNRPLLFTKEGKIFLTLTRRSFTGSSPRDKPSPITLLQADALDSVQFAAAEHAIRIEPRAGDLQFINNLNVVHSREKFEDSSIGMGSQRRHAVRAFITNDERAYPLPEELKETWAEVYPANSDSKYADYTFLVDPFYNIQRPASPGGNG